MVGTAIANNGKRQAAKPLGVFLFLCAWAAGGCRSCEPVEAELRKRECQVRELREQLQYSQCLNESLTRGMQVYQQQTVDSKPVVERNVPILQLKEVALGRQTGGYDNDGLPGDEGLQVVVEPRDIDGHSIKAMGSLQITALEITTQGVKAPLATWDIPDSQLRQRWRSGLLSTGYFVQLPWQTWPTSNRIRVVARFMLADGIVYEAERDVTIINARPPVPAGPELLGPPRSESPAPVPIIARKSGWTR